MKRSIKFTLLLLVIYCPLICNIEHAFKEFDAPICAPSIAKIDYIYIINLDQRPEKFESCQLQLLPYGIEAFRFSAVNGWHLTQEMLDSLGIVYSLHMEPGKWGTCYLPENEGKPQHEIMEVPGRVYFSHCMSRGAIGIVLSHLSILQQAFDAGHDTIWIMEDDIDVIQNPHLLSLKIQELDQQVGRDNWDILFTDRDTKNRNGDYVPCYAYAWRPNFSPKNATGYNLRRDVGNQFKEMGARYGAYSMIVRRSGMEKLLRFFKTYNVFLPYDIDFNMVPDIHMFSLLDDIVSTQIDAPSDNGAANYLKTGAS